MSRYAKGPLSQVEHSGEGQDGDHQDEVFTSAPIIDRSSTFVAHFHPQRPQPPSSPYSSSAPTSLTLRVKACQAHADFASADHRMVAWRRVSTQRTLGGAISNNGQSATNFTYTTGSDDDGEKYAGKRLEKVLNEMGVQGTVVVARWYGGILLGPVRFTHIENVAREAVGRWKAKMKRSNGGVGDEDGDGDSGLVKRRKVLENAGGGIVSGSGTEGPAKDTAASAAAEEAERTRLAKQLVDRDNSIVVLRRLLAEKTRAAASAASQENETNATPNPSKGDQTGETEPASQSTSHPPVHPSDNLPSSQPVPSPTSAAISKIPVEYTDFPLARIRQLHKARDATIAFILKQLDRFDEQEEKQAKGENGGDAG